jgi:hypothetical protein
MRNTAQPRWPSASRTRMVPNISLQPTGLSVKHSAGDKSRMLATEARG